MVQEIETAVLGGGCFWCLEAAFDRLRGVHSVEPGFAGGRRENPSYEQVCSGATGHAEVVRVSFDPSVLSYQELLELFFVCHDPTTLNRQGPDTGTQYRSIILPATAAQERQAGESIARLEAERVFPDPIVTEVVPLDRFWPAEAHHRQYFRRNPEQAYCAAVIAPKVAKLRTLWSARMVP